MYIQLIIYTVLDAGEVEQLVPVDGGVVHLLVQPLLVVGLQDIKFFFLSTVQILPFLTPEIVLLL